jgi:hypothetical protein
MCLVILHKAQYFDAILWTMATFKEARILVQKRLPSISLVMDNFRRRLNSHNGVQVFKLNL